MKPYKIGIITGWKILEKNLGGLPFIARATDQESLFSMLEEDRIDVAVFDLIEGNEILSHRKKTGVLPLKPFLDSQEMFIYMNKRHASLIAPLTNTLKDMKRDGTFQRINSQLNR